MSDRMTVLAWSAPVLALSKEERLLLWVSILAGVLVVGGLFLGRLDRWRKRQMEEPDDSPEQLGTFRDMFERGELSKEEYDRVLRRVAERVGAKPKPKPVPVVTPEPAPGPPATEEPPSAPPG
jgi:hypothetical protein